MRKRFAIGGLVLAVAAGGLFFLVPGGPQIVTRPALAPEPAPLPGPPAPAPEDAPRIAETPPAIVLPGARPEPNSEYAFSEAPIPPAIAILLVPVERVTPDQLADTWGDARAAGRSHQAIDIPAPRGTPVLAADSGTIAKFFDSADGGTTIYQRDSTGDYIFYYAHLDSRAPGLTEGDRVAAGQVIGYVGTTGNAAEDSPHLHFEIAIAPEDGSWSGGTPINPYDVLAR